jgi:outer membrane biosynthesis protein TonB
MDLSPLSLSDLAKQSAPAQPLPPSDYPLNLELAARDTRSYRQIAAIGAGSLLVHLIVFLIAIKIPAFVEQTHPERLVVEHRTPLYFPRELTQKDANKNKISKEIDLASLRAALRAQQQQQASPSPSVRHFEPPQNVGAPQTRSAPKIMPDAPNLAMNQTPADPTSGAIGGVPTAPPPPKPTTSLLQNAGAQAPPKITQPKAPPPPGATRPALSEDNPSVPAPALPGLPGQTGAEHAAIELLSDPQGADFKPYLERILAIIRANWDRVKPPGVRQGRLRGLSIIEVVINRDGSIPRVVVAQSSNLTLLDVAASTSLVMSNPLPPLPPEFKGNQVRLALRFAYNMPIQ